MNTAERARGKWRGILLALGVDGAFLKGTHGPCPFCAGRDRFRWDNRDGKGTFICSQCGAGDGFEFLKRLKGWDFRTAAKEIDAVTGHVGEADKPKPEMTEQQRRDMINRIWSDAVPMNGDDLASQYLRGRGVLPGRIPGVMRFHPRCPVPNSGGYLPAMIALVQDDEGNAVTLHRTFLGPRGKAEIETPRALLTGRIAPGSSVRIYPVHGERLGIAEGIETAIAAAKRFNLPVWAALNATQLKNWMPPAGVTQVVVFGDNDPAFGGQAAAYELAHKLAARHRIAVEVIIPQLVGRDWADADAA